MSNHKAVAAAALVGAAIICSSASSPAQDLTPRWTLSGRGLVTTPFHVTGTGESSSSAWKVLDYADTSLGSRLDSALFNEAIGTFALAARLTDADSPVAPVYLHEVEAAIQSRYLVVRAGRGRRPGPGLMFPVLRDEDLLGYVYPLNPYSRGALEEDALFSDAISVVGRLDFRWHLQLGVESLRDTVRTGDAADAAGPRANAAFARLYFDQLPSLAKIGLLKHAELAVFAQWEDEQIPGSAGAAMAQIAGSVAHNLFPDPIHLLDARAAALYQHGSTNVAWQDEADRWRARAVSGALALRYLYAPYQLERFQAAVSVGAKRYVDRPAYELSVVPALVFRAGANVDLAAQYIGTYHSLGTQRFEERYELAFSYRFDVKVNDTINLPRDLLNAEYNYIPVN